MHDGFGVLGHKAYGYFAQVSWCEAAETQSIAYLLNFITMTSPGKWEWCSDSSVCILQFALQLAWISPGVLGGWSQQGCSQDLVERAQLWMGKGSHWLHSQCDNWKRSGWFGWTSGHWCGRKVSMGPLDQGPWFQQSSDDLHNLGAEFGLSCVFTP